jgi:hypothetical protein
MKHGSDDMSVVCCLTRTELRECETTLLAQFRSAVIGIEELRNGYALRVPGDGKWVGLIAELIVAERECCLFLTFEVAALPNVGSVIVRAIVPAGTKELLRTVLCKTHAFI